MILFEQDWYEKFNGRAIIHTTTKNSSFIQQSVILKQLGISNNKFMLSLVQPELLYHDPHNLKDDSIELKAKIALECKINPWYYFREIVRIPVSSSIVPFKLDRANMALIWCYYNNIDVFETISRQLGKTVSTQAIMAHILYFYGKRIKIGMLTNSRKLISENVIRLKDIRDSHPKYLMNVSTKDTNNKEGIDYKALRNEYKTLIIPDSEQDANNTGRGLTIPSLHWDEFGYSKNNDIAYSVAVTATSAAAAQARERGMPCSNIITTTAALLDSKEGRYAFDILSKAMKFTESIYDSRGKEALLELLKKNSLNNMIYICFSFLQLGQTKEWLHETVTRANKTQDEIDTDYLCIWKHGAENSVVPSHLLKKLKESELEPLYSEIDAEEKYQIRWYISEPMRKSEEFRSKSLIIGLDSSENIGRDYSSLVIIDPADMAVVGTVKCNESNIIRLASFISKLLIEFKKSIFIPERKSSGATIIDFVLIELHKKGINPYFRIYNEVIQEMDTTKFKNINIYHDPEGEVRKYFGFSTNSEKRNLLYKQVLLKTIEMNHSRIYDTHLINEICQLTTRSGRIDHATKGHDDTIFAYMLACYLIFFGNNLEKYGLNRNNMLTRVSSSGESVDQLVLTEQDVIRNKILNLERKIKQSCSILVTKSYERELADLLTKVDDSLAPVNVISKEHVKKDPTKNNNVTSEDLQRFFRSTVF